MHHYLKELGEVVVGDLGEEDPLEEGVEVDILNE